MKKVIMIFLGMAITLATFAQTVPTKKAAEKDVKADVKDLKQERMDRNTAIAHGKMKTAKIEQKEIKEDRKRMHANKKHLKNKGVKDPIDKARDDVKHP
jgi:hypothetical protein